MNKLSQIVNKVDVRIMCYAVCLIMGFAAFAQKNEKSMNQNSEIEFTDELILIGNNKNSLSLTKDGPGSGGGGNACSLAIAQNKAKLFSVLAEAENSGVSILNSSDTETMKQKLVSTKIYKKQRTLHLILDNQTKDAINFPAKNAILLSSYFCRTEMVDVSARSMSLLFHEFLGLLAYKTDGTINTKFDDRSYQISGKLLDYLSQLNKTHNVIREQLLAEAKQDLARKKSIFKGEMIKFQEDLSETSFGTFNQDTLDMDIIQTDSFDLKPLKYSSAYYDKNWKKIDPSAYSSDKFEIDLTALGVKYTQYNQESDESYIVVVKFHSGDAGGAKTTTRSFRVDYEKKWKIITDDMSRDDEPKAVVAPKHIQQYLKPSLNITLKRIQD